MEKLFKEHQSVQITPDILLGLHDMGLYSLQRLSTDDTSRQIVKDSCDQQHLYHVTGDSCLTKSTVSKSSFANTIRESNGLDPDQA